MLTGAPRAPALVLKLYYHGGIGVVRSLGRLGVPVYAIHDDARVPAARSRYLRDVRQWDFAAAPEDDSLAFVMDTGRRLGEGTVLIAADDTAQEFVSRHAEELSATFRFPRQPPGLTEQLYSKQGLHDLCVRHGVPTPRNELPRSVDEARGILERASFPLVLKPVDKLRFQERNGIPMYIAADHADALEAYERLADHGDPDILLQEYLPGPSAAVWVFTGYFDGDSELRFGAGGTKLRQYPIRTGTTCFGDVRPNTQLEALTARFVKAIGYSGVWDCGYRYDERDGTYKLLDVNPRVGANFRQCVGRDGMDVVRAMYLDLCGEPVPSDAPDEGRVWWVENYDTAAAAQAFRERSLSPRRWAGSLRRVDEPAWFARDDPAPFAAMCAQTGRAVVRRAASAVRK